MLPTIVFFFALFISISLLITICEYILDRFINKDLHLIERNKKHDEFEFMVPLLITTCLLWSWLYWLSH